MRKRRKILSFIKAGLFLAPFLIFFVFVIVYPVLFGVHLSLYGQRGIRMWYVGIHNYIAILTDMRFWSAFRIPIYLLTVQVPLMLFIATFIALMYEQIKRSQIYRLIYYLPYLVPGIIAGILWSYMFSGSMSPFIPLLNLLGLSDVKILTRANMPLLLLVIILWEFTGYTALIIYSSLLSIPRECTEQANLDGANFWQIAFYIKIPLLRNTLLVLFIFNAIGALQVFNEPWMLAELITLPTHYTPAMYIYNTAFYYGSFTYATAMGLILACVTFMISFFFLRAAVKQLQTRV